ncbi:hypothetical protein NZNM25_07930 [Nitrosopumilus zosterae]|uniref:Thrombospondin n=1 Tax=Nitrosopumilus zosterae TaxID=718286 RepID=A0A2S2KQQ5_9ARCH|nr:thrombospondin type 3 repeat-containing protein [Nitrosopumilus zosterae]BDQ30566.1 thrombospondin type 3 repeat-containing protein [Nitrosopumilus zosterae]GBH34002.1 hypothetical protein NZNM25_07930 [Nitrosopumilus zosterae]
MAIFVIDKKIKFLFVLLIISLGVSFLAWSEYAIFADSDNDGTSDSFDNCPLNPNMDQSDFDLDKSGDVCDTDDDNDGVKDNLDQFDTDPLEWADFDFDNLGANQDSDDDNDGLTDMEDSFPILVSQKLVEENLSEIESCAILETGTSKLLCYSQFFQSLVVKEENNVDTLELALSLTQLGAVDDCHFISHEIGHAAYAENSNIFENLSGVDGSVCRGGFYHGVMAAYFHELQENNKDMGEYKTICNDFIGKPEYTKCVHGLGHGITHYFINDLNSAINACDQMSFYQSSICVGGVFMQYTDDELTRSTSIKQDIQNICPKSDLRIFDYQQCRDNLGLSIAFHTDHDLEEGSKLCDMIIDDMGKQYCHRGLEREINDAKEYKVYDPTKGVRELMQPVWIKENDSNKWIVDFRSPSKISNVVYDETTKMMQFSFDAPYRIIIYMSTDLLPENPVVMINGQQNDFEIQHGLYDNHSMIQIMPKNSGVVLIS